MNIKTFILLLAGCIFYLESQKGSELINVTYLLGSYIFISVSILNISSRLFKEAEKVKLN